MLPTEDLALNPAPSPTRNQTSDPSILGQCSIHWVTPARAITTDFTLYILGAYFNKHFLSMQCSFLPLCQFLYCFIYLENFSSYSKLQHKCSLPLFSHFPPTFLGELFITIALRICGIYNKCITTNNYKYLFMPFCKIRVNMWSRGEFLNRHLIFFIPSGNGPNGLCWKYICSNVIENKWIMMTLCFKS